MREALFRMSGVDLTGIDAIGVGTVQVALSVYGPDLSRFPTEKQTLTAGRPERQLLLRFYVDHRFSDLPKVLTISRHVGCNRQPGSGLHPAARREEAELARGRSSCRCFEVQ